MNKRLLGKTGLNVSELALGGFFTSTFGGSFEESRKAIQSAISLGMNLIDTAPNYANSEEVIGKSLRDFRDDKSLIFCTKIGGKPTPFLPQDKDCIQRSVETSLKLLGRDFIDIMFIHEPDRPKQYNWWTDLNAVEGPALALLLDLKRQNIIRHIGLAGTTVYEMAGILQRKHFDVLLTAFNYSLLFREAERYLIPVAAKQGTGVIVGSALHMGSLAVRYDDEVNNGGQWMSPQRRAQFKALYHLLDETGMTLPEMGFRMVLSNPDVSCVLSGIRSEEEVIQNVAIAGKGPLDAALLKRLNEIADMVPYRPFEEPFALPFGQEYKGPGYVNTSKI